MRKVVVMGLRRAEGAPEFGPSDWELPTKEDRAAGEEEPDPYTSPCPFCGSKYTQVRWIGFADTAEYMRVSGMVAGFKGECTDCWATTRACATKEDAAYWWNIRANK